MMATGSLGIRQTCFGATLAALTALAAVLVPSVFALDIHVSPQGSDNYPGTLAAPVKTLEAARKLAQLKAGRELVTITVADGIYYFDKPLVLTSARDLSRSPRRKGHSERRYAADAAMGAV
jgi:hypothetical protein